MLLSTIICPQYLRGGGGLGSFPYMPIILAVPLVVHRHIYALHHPPHHHIQREERDSHIATLFIRPYVKRPYSMAKALLLYYLIVFFGHNSLYFNTLDTLFMNPKGSQAFCFDDWRASWTHLGHTLDTPCSLVTANIRSNLQRIAVFRLLSMSQKSHKSFCRGFNVKNQTF